MRRTSWIVAFVGALALAQQPATAPAPTEPGVAYRGERGPLHGKRIVFLAGDEEYRSEQSLPQLARILAFRHGADCAVRFSTDPRTGAIDPGATRHLPGLDALATADLLVLLLRFRDLPDADMQRIADHVDAGKPIVALRTSTHAFALRKESKFAAWSWNAPDGGFGRNVLGETWIAHHGEHGVQGTRGALAPDTADHPILRGLQPDAVWDPADVYRVRLPLPDGCLPLLLGDVLQTTKPDAPAVADQGLRMPIAWVRERKVANGGVQRVFTTTIGSAEAFAAAGSRRLLVNACFWALGRADAITADLDVALVGDYAPLPFGFGKHGKDVLPASLAWPPPKGAEPAPK